MQPEPSPDEPVVGQITLRYWAAARSAAGISQEQVAVPGPVSLAWLIEESVARRDPSGPLAGVLARCSVLLGELPVKSADPATVMVSPGDSVEFLPPFAGG